MELQPDDWPRSSLGIRSGSNDAVGPHQEFTRRFAEGIGKLVGNMSGDRRKKTIGLAVIMSGATGLVGRIGQSQVQASGQGSNDAVGNSLEVHRELTDGIGSLPGWRKRVRRKKIETRRKIVGSSRKAYRELGKS
ncbi:hypothetical protein BHM03_00050130 [Ensete ventricosum]|nr:hypothetical protein BHM03_00050130 [Ensete ventricosum]